MNWISVLSNERRKKQPKKNSLFANFFLSFSTKCTQTRIDWQFDVPNYNSCVETRQKSNPIQYRHQRCEEFTLYMCCNSSLFFSKSLASHMDFICAVYPVDFTQLMWNVMWVKNGLHSCLLLSPIVTNNLNFSSHFRSGLIRDFYIYRKQKKYDLITHSSPRIHLCNLSYRQNEQSFSRNLNDVWKRKCRITMPLKS